MLTHSVPQSRHKLSTSRTFVSLSIRVNTETSYSNTFRNTRRYKKLDIINAFSHFRCLWIALEIQDTARRKGSLYEQEDETGRGNGGWHQPFIDYHRSDRDDPDDFAHCLLYLCVPFAVLSIGGRARTCPQYDASWKQPKTFQSPFNHRDERFQPAHRDRARVTTTRLSGYCDLIEIRL